MAAIADSPSSPSPPATSSQTAPNQSSLPNSQVITSKTRDFRYQPPPATLSAQHILVKPNLGYPVGPPVTVSVAVLRQVLTALRQANATAQITVIEGVCSKVSLDEIAQINGLYDLFDSLQDSNLNLVNADDLPLKEYPNLSPAPVRFKTMWAPALVETADCRISIGALKQNILKGEPLISAALKNLYGLFPRAKYKARSPNSRGQLHRPSVPLVLQDVYGCIGHLFDGAVVDGDRQFVSKDWKPDKGQSIELGQVFQGEDLLAVDREACRIGDFPAPSYIASIEQLRQQWMKH